MRAKKSLGLVLWVVLALFACKKNKDKIPGNGIYRGIFSRILENDDTAGTGVVFLALTAQNGSFSVQGDTSSNAPYSCNGTYGVLEEGKIVFNSKSFIGEVVEDPFYDPYYYLDTVYRYEITESSFILDLAFDTVRYNYNLSPY